MVSLLKFNCELVSDEPNLQNGFQSLNHRSQRFILKKFCIWIIFSLLRFDRISFLWHVVAQYGEVAASLCCIRKLPDGSTGSDNVLLHVLNMTNRLFVQLFSKIFFGQTFIFPNLVYGLFPDWECEIYHTDMWYVGLKKNDGYQSLLSKFANFTVLKHTRQLPTYSDGSWQYIL